MLCEFKIKILTAKILEKILIKIYIPIKMEDFFNAEISIYSRTEFFIYLFEDLYKAFLMKTRVRRFFSKMFEDFLQIK